MGEAEQQRGGGGRSATWQWPPGLWQDSGPPGPFCLYPPPPRSLGTPRLVPFARALGRWLPRPGFRSAWDCGLTLGSRSRSWLCDGDGSSVGLGRPFAGCAAVRWPLRSSVPPAEGSRCPGQGLRGSRSPPPSRLLLRRLSPGCLPREGKCRPPLALPAPSPLSQHARGVPLPLASRPLLLLGPAAFLARRACVCAPPLPSLGAFPWTPLPRAARRFSGGGAVSARNFFPVTGAQRKPRQIDRSDTDQSGKLVYSGCRASAAGDENEIDRSETDQSGRSTYSGCRASAAEDLRSKAGVRGGCRPSAAEPSEEPGLQSQRSRSGAGPRKQEQLSL
ncbi:uncharacterized protein LOC142823256 [Pelodiscus sinensis]|uniref:uncharacterized protein LOC142823256 n=1 Tax=Pelodiscus sinensis TaxID=13735 RepID=UPI003F6A6BC2